MKKVLFLSVVVFIFIGFVCISCNVVLPKTFTVYTDETPFFLKDCKKQNFNNYSTFTTSINNFNQVFNNISKCYSIECTYSQLNIDDIRKEFKARIVEVNIVNDIVVYNLYSKLVQKYLNLDCKKFNMQVSIINSEIKIGIPLLIGSY